MMVSVLVPAYNAEKTIRRCIDSVLAQSYSDYELLVVNDGSKDATLSILETYVLADDRIRVIDQMNKGVAGARNALLNNACGEYLLFLDADDWIEPVTIEHTLALADDKTDIVFFSADHATSSADREQVDTLLVEVWDRQRQLLEFMKHQRMTGMLWNKLMRRSCTTGCGFNEKTGYGEDAEFLWQVLKQSKQMVVTNEILYHHVPELTSISHRPFSEKKYSAIPMWESIVAEVERDYPTFSALAKERLMSVAVFSAYEIMRSHYSNREHIEHISAIVRKNLRFFLFAKDISLKQKLFSLLIRAGVAFR